MHLLALPSPISRWQYLRFVILYLQIDAGTLTPSRWAHRIRVLSRAMYTGKCGLGTAQTMPGMLASGRAVLQE